MHACLDRGDKDTYFIIKSSKFSVSKIAGPNGLYFFGKFIFVLGWLNAILDLPRPPLEARGEVISKKNIV